MTEPDDSSGPAKPVDTNKTTQSPWENPAKPTETASASDANLKRLISEVLGIPIEEVKSVEFLGEFPPRNQHNNDGLKELLDKLAAKAKARLKAQRGGGPFRIREFMDAIENLVSAQFDDLTPAEQVYAYEHLAQLHHASFERILNEYKRNLGI